MNSRPRTKQARNASPHRLGDVYIEIDDTPTKAIDPDELISAAAAAEIAGRSVRTIRRAYLSGRLIAYRDGGGRGVRIRYADLRAWLMSKPVAAAELREETELPLKRTAPRRRRRRGRSAEPSENMALLTAARNERSLRAAAGVDALHAGSSAPSSRA